MKFSGKMWFMIILKVIKNQKTHFWKNHRGGQTEASINAAPKSVIIK